MGDITQAFNKQWDDTIRIQAQQNESRLSACVNDRGSITGESFTANRLAPLDDTPENNVRNGDTEWSSANHSTRIAVMKDFFQALPVDRADESKVLANPNGSYMQSLVSAWNRRQDSIIFNALIGGARDKDDNIIAIPNGQKILNGSTQFTKTKLITARKLFRKNEADQHNGEELFICYTAEMLEDLMADTTLTSAEYMGGKMLQEGDVSKQWMGFIWVPYEAIPFNYEGVGASVASTMAWAKSAIHKGTGFVEGRSQRRGDKKDTMQVSMAASAGAVRVEEEKVVRIDFVV